MHPSALAFVTVALTSVDVAGRAVIEAGALDVNGSARPWVESLSPASYLGTDMRPGARVDVVCRAEDLPVRFGPGTAGIVLTTEMLEHAVSWRAAMRGLIGVLAEGGILVLTTRGPGFPGRGHPGDSWRFTVPAMRAILEAARLRVLVCVPDTDPASPGVFAKAAKPARWIWPSRLDAKWEQIKVEAVVP